MRKERTRLKCQKNVARVKVTRIKMFEFSAKKTIEIANKNINVWITNGNIGSQTEHGIGNSVKIP